jgi:hypothetical protein
MRLASLKCCAVQSPMQSVDQREGPICSNIRVDDLHVRCEVQWIANHRHSVVPKIVLATARKELTASKLIEPESGTTSHHHQPIRSGSAI